MTAYEMRISDWSSDVCSSDLTRAVDRLLVGEIAGVAARRIKPADIVVQQIGQRRVPDHRAGCGDPCAVGFAGQMRPQPRILADHQMAVAAELDVNLQTADADGQRGGEGGEGVFRHQAAGAAMAFKIKSKERGSGKRG